MRLLLVLILLSFASIFAPPAQAQERWIQLKSVTDVQLMAVQFFDANHGYVAGRNGSFLSTSDGGNTWQQTQITAPHPFSKLDIYDMYFHDAETGVVVGSLDTSNGFVAEPRATLFWTYDGGKTWDIQTFDEDGAILNIQFLDRKFAFFTASRNDGIGKASVYYTNGGGFRTELWQKRTTFPGPQIIQGMAFKNNAVGIVSAGDELVIPNNLYYTEDAGETWSTYVGDNNGSSSSFGAFHWNDDGLLATSGSRILFSLDQGHNWGVVASTAGGEFYRGFSFADNLVGFATPFISGQVLKTTNGGYAWEVQQMPEPTLIQDLWAVSEQIAYAVGTNGKMFKLTSQSSVAAIDGSIASLSVYPNPAHTFAHVEIASANHVRSGHIFDRLGREVLAFNIDLSGSVQLDLRSLQPGAYSVVIDGQATNLIVH
jgi:photosystem II stability/assembly factor-like uncharacterized protein